MNKLSLLARTILHIYSQLEFRADKLDEVINQFALGCWNLIDTPSALDKIIDLSERKVSLINIKVLINSILEEMDIKQSKILIERYIKNRTHQDIANNFNISIRSVFRKLRSAEENFRTALLKNGYDERKIGLLLEDQTWIVEVKDKIRKDGNCNESEICI